MNDLRKNIINNPLESISYLLWGSNKKIGAIPSLIGESPLNCSSAKLGYCEVCKECYAKSDYKQYSNHRERVDKCILFFELLKVDNDIYNIFERALSYFNVFALRYNLEGDFKGEDDIKLVEKIAKFNPKIKVYGYSKRKDLKEPLESALTLNNFYCGVNFECKGANWFEVVNDISDWYFNPNKCLGDCQTCRKCFSLKGEHISCFIHGSPSKIQKRINNIQNWEFLSAICKQYLGTPLNTKEIPSGLFVHKANKNLEERGVEVPFKLTKKGYKSYTLNTIPKLINWVHFQGGF